MVSQDTNTNPDARKVQLEAIRAMDPRHRVAIAVDMSEQMMEISRAGNRAAKAV